MQSPAPKELSWSALARGLGVTRPTLYVWKSKPGHPEGRKLEDWQKWVDENDLGGDGGNPDLKDENLRLRNQKLQLEIAEKERKSIPKAEADRVVFHLATTTKTMIYQGTESTLAPKLDGMSAAQMRPILREWADEIVGRLASVSKELEGP